MPRQSKEEKKSRAKKKQTLPIMVEALHNARIALREAEGTLDIETALFNKKNEKKINAVEAAKLAVQLNDETLRLAMLAEYVKTGQIALGPGLDIKQRKSAECSDPGYVREWALTHASWLLELDMDKVTLMAMAIPMSIPSTRIMEIPTPYVAKDLNKALDSYSKPEPSNR